MQSAKPASSKACLILLSTSRFPADDDPIFKTIPLKQANRNMIVLNINGAVPDCVPVPQSGPIWNFNCAYLPFELTEQFSGNPSFRFDNGLHSFFIDAVVGHFGVVKY